MTRPVDDPEANTCGCDGTHIDCPLASADLLMGLHLSHAERACPCVDPEDCACGCWQHRIARHVADSDQRDRQVCSDYEQFGDCVNDDCWMYERDVPCGQELHAGPTGVWLCERVKDHAGPCWKVGQVEAPDEGVQRLTMEVCPSDGCTLPADHEPDPCRDWMRP